MANPLRDMSVFMQALVAVAVAVVLMVAGVERLVGMGRIIRSR